MNRHIRTRHPGVFNSEVMLKKHDNIEVASEVEVPVAKAIEDVADGGTLLVTNLEEGEELSLFFILFFGIIIYNISSWDS